MGDANTQQKERQVR